MTKEFKVRFNTTLDITVKIDADDEAEAEEQAWDVANEYLATVYGNNRDIFADASLDGVGAYEVTRD